MKFFKEFIERLKQETPPFFRKLFWFFITLGTACTAVIVGEQSFALHMFPEWTKEPIQTLAFIGWVSSILVKLPVLDPDRLKK